MGFGRRVWILALAAIALLAGAGPFSREVPAQDARTFYNRFRRGLQLIWRAPPHERGAKRTEVLQLRNELALEVEKDLANDLAGLTLEAREALVEQKLQERMEKEIALLISEITNPEKAKDESYVANCVIILGQLKACAATPVLLKRLEAPNKEISYQAAAALGEIWADRSPDEERLKRINGALLSRLAVDVSEAEIFAPAMALLRINRAPGPEIRLATPKRLMEAVDTWVEGNLDKLPPPSKQSLSLLIRFVVRLENPQARNEALAVLTSRKPLAAIDYLLQHLRLEKDKLKSKRRRELGKLLGAITGVPFPPKASPRMARSPERLVKAWVEEWYKYLKRPGARSEKHMRYVWNSFESSLRSLNLNYSDAVAERIRRLWEVILFQAANLDDIPENASPKAKSLVESQLAIKETIAKTVRQIESTQEAIAKLELLHRIHSQLDKDGALVVAGQFLEKLAQVARKEENQDVLNKFGDLMTHISGIPCQLSSDIKQRGKDIDDWLKQLREKQGIMS